MRTYLAVPLVMVVVAGLLFTGGCVSQEQYKEALAACRRANDELVETQTALRASQDAKAQLELQLSGSGTDILGKNKEIALVEKRNAELQKRFDELSALYRKLQETDLPALQRSPLPAPVDAALADFAKANPQLVEYLPGYGMVKFKSDFTFDKGSDAVSATAAEALGQLAAILNSSAAQTFHIYVAGHTDDIPIKKADTRRRHPNNWYLSVHRAVSVEKVLTKAGLEPRRIGVMGFGEYHPIAPNAPGKKGNRLNRRVEIWILPPDRFLTAAAPLVEEK